MSERSLSAIVLAAGEGTRMKSSRPKPLHLLAGRTMLQYMLDSLADCKTGHVVVVVGHGAERVTKKLQAAELLGYQPKVPLDEGIRRAVAWSAAWAPKK